LIGVHVMTTRYNRDRCARHPRLGNDLPLHGLRPTPTTLRQIVFGVHQIVGGHLTRFLVHDGERGTPLTSAEGGVHGTLTSDSMSDYSLSRPCSPSTSMFLRISALRPRFISCLFAKAVISRDRASRCVLIRAARSTRMGAG